jgi:predicted PurR-regulated permease PerM
MSDYPDVPALDPAQLDAQLLDELQQMQRTVIFCTIAVVVAFVVIIPPLIYLYFSKLERNTTNLLDYYEKLEEGASVKNKKSLI